MNEAYLKAQRGGLSPPAACELSECRPGSGWLLKRVSHTLTYEEMITGVDRKATAVKFSKPEIYSKIMCFSHFWY